MANLNKVLLMGNLTRDPEVRYTPKGTAVTELGIAVNRIYTGENGEKREEVTFVDVTVWGRTAENVGEYLRKGRPVFIEGRSAARFLGRQTIRSKAQQAQGRGGQRAISRLPR